ncbi:hypothetical protein LINGRAHAP2_LOCUS23081 [Linum grandiflorum]
MLCCESKAEVQRIKALGRCRFGSIGIQLDQWIKGAGRSSVAFVDEVVWIQIRGIPLHLRSPDLFKQLGNRCGQFLDFEEMASLSMVRIKIKMVGAIPEIIPLFFEQDIFPVIVSPEEVIPFPSNGDRTSFFNKWNSKGKSAAVESRAALIRGCSPDCSFMAGTSSPVMAERRVVVGGGREYPEKEQLWDMFFGQKGQDNERKFQESESCEETSYFVDSQLVPNDMVGFQIGKTLSKKEKVIWANLNLVGWLRKRRDVQILFSLCLGPTSIFLKGPVSRPLFPSFTGLELEGGLSICGPDSFSSNSEESEAASLGSTVFSTSISSGVIPNEQSGDSELDLFQAVEKVVEVIGLSFQGSRVRGSEMALDTCLEVCKRKGSSAGWSRTEMEMHRLGIDLDQVDLVPRRARRERLKTVMPLLVAEQQCAFIKDRQVLDAALIANELIDSRIRSGRAGVVFKLDIEKAYDHVNWNCLLSCLLQRSSARGLAFALPVHFGNGNSFQNPEKAPRGGFGS